MPAPKRDITPWELTTNGARQHPGDGGPGLAEASAGREMSRIRDSVAVIQGARLCSRIAVVIPIPCIPSQPAPMGDAGLRRRFAG